MTAQRPPPAQTGASRPPSAVGTPNSATPASAAPQPKPEPSAPQNPLSLLPSMFHAVLCQTADVFNSPSRQHSRAVMYTNAQLNTSIPVLTDRFHYGLDFLELEILRAKAVLRRDLDIILRERQEKERERIRREEEEAEAEEAEARRRRAEEIKVEEELEEQQLQQQLLLLQHRGPEDAEAMLVKPEPRAQEAPQTTGLLDDEDLMILDAPPPPPLQGVAGGGGGGGGGGGAGVQEAAATIVAEEDTGPSLEDFLAGIPVQGAEVNGSGQQHTLPQEGDIVETLDEGSNFDDLFEDF